MNTFAPGEVQKEEGQKREKGKEEGRRFFMKLHHVFPPLNIDIHQSSEGKAQAWRSQTIRADSKIRKFQAHHHLS